MAKRGYSRRAGARTGEKEKHHDHSKGHAQSQPSDESSRVRGDNEMHDTASEASREQANGNDSVILKNDVQKEPTDSDYSDIIFQCAKCHTVVGDSRSPHVVNLEHNTLSLRAASNVRVEDKLHVCQKGFACGCTFKRILCDNCDTAVGRIYSSTVPALDQYRSLYTLDYDSLDSYRLGSGRTPDGETLDVPNSQHPKPQRDGEEPRVSTEDFIALDTYVTDLGKAVNKQTDAMDQYGKALEELQKDFKDSDNLMKDIRQCLEYTQNIMLVWEERFRNFDSFKERANKLFEEFQGGMKSCQSTGRKFSKLDASVDRLVIRFGNIERITAKLNAKIDGHKATEARFDDKEPVVGDKIKGTFAPVPYTLPRNSRYKQQTAGRSSPRAKRRRS